MEVRVSPTEQGGFYDEELFPVQIKLDGSRFPVPDGPGLGVDFNEELADEQTFKFSLERFLRRADGSLTNS